MMTKTRLGAGPGFLVEEVRCTTPPSPWSCPETSPGHCLVLVRSGVFRRRAGGVETVLDPTVGYVEQPGDQQQIAHPSGGTDVCTAISLSERLVADLAGGESGVPTRPVFTDGPVDLAHRRLLARAGLDGEFELAERVVEVAVAAFGQSCPERVASGRPATALARRRLVDDTREALAAVPRPLGLTELARLVGASPHHLSRVFRQETGMTLTQFRNRLRVRRALDRIAAGEPSLARIAAELGFADHAHLTRTMSEETGHPPAGVRRLLAGAEASMDLQAGSPSDDESRPVGRSRPASGAPALDDATCGGASSGRPRHGDPTSDDPVSDIPTQRGDDCG